METGKRMSRRSRRDYLQSIYARYQKADRREKRRILDEFCANCRYHRKHAIRLLNRALPRGPSRPRPRKRGRTYGAKTVAVLKAVWEAADYPWSVRLKALLPEWMPWIRRRFQLKAETEHGFPRAQALGQQPCGWHLGRPIPARRGWVGRVRRSKGNRMIPRLQPRSPWAT